MIVRELFARLGIKQDPGSFQRADQSLNKVKQVATAIAGILAGGFIVRGFRDIVLGTTAAADSVAKMSKRLGVNAQALQELQYAAQISGASAQDLSNGLRILQRFADEAAQGTKEYADEFRRLGVTVKDAATGKLKPAEQIFTEMADGMAGLETATERTAIAQKLLGRGGTALVPLFAEGAKGIEALRIEAQKTGGIFSSEFLQASEDMTDQLLRLKMSGMGLKVTLTNALLPAINTFVEWMMKTGSAIMEALKGTKLLEVAFGALAAIATVLALVLGFKLLGAIGGLGIAAVKLAAGFTAAGNAALIMQIKAAAIGVAVLAAIALVVLLIEDLYVFATGGESLIGHLLEKWQAWMEDFANPESVKEGEHPVITFLRSLVSLILQAQQALSDLLSGEEWKSPRFWAAVKTLKELMPGGKAVENALKFYGKEFGYGSKVAPSQGAAGGSVSSTSQVNITQNIATTSGQSPEAVAKASGEAIKGVLREERKQALQALFPAIRTGTIG